MTTPSEVETAIAPVVYVIDDDPSVRAALEDLLASVGLDVQTFGSTHDFVASDVASSPAPGCLVLDIRMPGKSGLEFQRQMGELGIYLPVIFITGHGDIPMSVQAMKVGAIEFLSKPFRDQDLLDAIQQGIEQDRARRREQADIDELRTRWVGLTTGELDVMELVVSGMLNKQIAAKLNVSEITVKVRRRHVMHKMGASSFADLVRMADRIAHVNTGR
jgi:FixJ family two-component response regulator